MSAPIFGVNLYEGKFEFRPEEYITGPNGHGPVDFAIDLLQTAKTVGMTEVKDEDLFKGMPFNSNPLYQTVKVRRMRWRKRVFVGKVFGIVTDVTLWKCSLVDQDRLKFKLSEPVVVVYKDENMENMVRKVLGHIAWLLEEVQKPDSDSRSGERVIKKHRSSSSLAEKSDTIDKS